MRWDRDHRSQNVDDRRGQGGFGGGMGGRAGPMLLMWVASRFGLPGLLLVLGIVLCVGFLGGGPGLVTEPEGGLQGRGAGPDEDVSFVSYVLDDAQQTWTEEFHQEGLRYDPARLVLFTDSTQTRCGYGTAATGPFYCPLDQQVYIDLAFYDQLSQRFGAPGDFAQAYVIAHEIGHHVQNQLGQLQHDGQTGPASSSVQQELQADCYAGVWARSAADRGLLDPGDIEEGMGAAAAIGDDRLQGGATGRVEPESWTHGSSAQRVTAFRRGFQGGFQACASAPVAG
jgi:predicted metalloprotease